MDALELREKAKYQLEQIHDLESGVDYLNKIKTIETWAKAEKKDAELQNMIAEQKLRTQRILGQLLKATKLDVGGRRKNTTINRSSNSTSLADYGISKYLSSTFQRIAGLPQDIFETEIATAKEETIKRVELTTSRMLSVANDFFKYESLIVDLTKEHSFEVETPNAIPYDSNLFYMSGESSDKRFGDLVFSLKDDKYYTLTTLQRFFHKETGKEFSLREYGDVQTFPEDYKFIGNYSAIKKQIGNAVAPQMGEYVSRNLKGKTSGDLFAGCGGFTCGLLKNGIKSKWAVEWDDLASKSYKLNHQDVKVYNANIKHLSTSDFEEVDIIIGGPPCQGFSNAGSDRQSSDERFKHDPRNQLYKEFARFVEKLNPKEFIMENVPEISNFSEIIINSFNGYKVKTELVCGNDIGMKQNRKRFFFHGTRMV